jgi:DNA-binding NarL/FixJ family response regulator
MDDLQILLADDHPVLRRRIRALLEAHPGWTICAEVSNGRDAVEQTRRLAPDVILLDMSMPELNGLEATREIVGKHRDAQVLILTMHASDDLAAEAVRIGAKGVVNKSAASDTLIPTIESLLHSLIRLAGSTLGPARHIAALFRSRAEQYRVLGPFVADGLHRGERAIHIIDPPDRQTHTESLRETGVDLDSAEAAGKARLISWKDAYLRGGRFDQDAMLEWIPQMLRDGASQGFPLTRLVAHMGWALSDRPGVENLIAYESRLNDVLPDFDDVVICVYDLTQFGGPTIVDVMRTHPVLLIGDTLRHNPFYVPPGRFTGAQH